MWNMLAEYRKYNFTDVKDILSTTAFFPQTQCTYRPILIPPSHSYRYNGCLALYNVLITSGVHSSVKSQFPKVRQIRYTVEDSCDGGISVLNHCLSWSKFVNTHLSHSGLTSNFVILVWCSETTTITHSNSNSHVILITCHSQIQTARLAVATRLVKRIALRRYGSCLVADKTVISC